jgi:hypothetical protein
MRAAGVVAATVGVLVALAATGRAGAAADYALDSGDWNGLGTFATIARAAGCVVERGTTLDWSTARASDVLFFVYPRSPIDPARLKRWLAAGGTAVIADDFGAAGPALQALSIERRALADGEAPETWDEHPALPIARPGLKTALGRAVPGVVANHPAALVTALPATYRFSDDAALLVEGHVGRGHFVALADPSVLINQMLELDDNRELVRVLAGELCAAGDRRIVVYSHGFTSRGEPPSELPRIDASSVVGQVTRGLERINDATAQTLADRAGRPALVVLALGLLAWALFTSFPSRNELSDDFVRGSARGGAFPLGPWVVIGPGGADYSALVAELRVMILGRLERLLGRRLAPERIGPRALGQLVAARWGPAAAREATELWRLLASVRWRVVAARDARELDDGEVTPDERISLVRLLAIHRRARALFGALDGAAPPTQASHDA